MSAEPIDLEVLRSFIGEDPAEMGASLALFVESAHRALVEIRQAGLEGNVPALGAVAHRFKSTALYLGAASLAATCARMERAASALELAAIRADLPALESETDRVLAAVAALRARLPAPPGVAQ